MAQKWDPWDPWTIGVSLIAGVVMLPILVIFGSFTAETGDLWRHLATTVLPRYLLNSFGLSVGVGIGVLVLGVGTAWLVTMCQFPGRGWYEWILLLPLSAPAYILAYAYTDFLQFAGPIQTALRSWFDWQANDYWFPNIRSLVGAILIFSLVLYPYVYLTARLAFLEQSLQTLEIGQSLGCNPWQSFRRVALPLAWPSIVVGLSLALMEVLNDYGTVQYFGVETFTTGIFRTWYGLGDRIAATQLACVLLLFISGLILIERWFRRQARYYHPSRCQRSRSRYPLYGIRALGSNLACLVPILFGFLLPFGLLVRLTLGNLESFSVAQLWIFGSHSLALAGITGFLGLLLALIMAYGERRNPFLSQVNQIGSSGYGIPGAVIAVGVLVITGFLDQRLETRFLSGTIAALVFAYLVRFLSLPFRTVESSLIKIRPHLDEAARSLGHHSGSILYRIHIPLLWPSFFSALLVLFVDVMKELPATLVIRPFNFDTLAVRVYQLASDERLAEAASPALAIVLVGLIPVVLLSSQISQSGSSK
jgi:iron(III) transport system permease protein